MEWLNYHHLLYFWTVAREGGIARAAERLHLTHPTISGQIKELERNLGERLFVRVGRGLELSPTGHVVFRYADEIFSLGREMLDTVKGRPTGRPLRLAVGVDDVLPKLVVRRLLEPALRLEEAVRLTVHEAPSKELFTRLAGHELDVVISDTPLAPHARVRAYTHELGTCSVSWFAVDRTARNLRRSFPRSLSGAHVLLPGANTALRRDIDAWCEKHDVRPIVVGEFDDSALMKSFGQDGFGAFPGPSVIEEEIQAQYGVRLVGRAKELRLRFHAISLERRIQNPGVVAITRAARNDLFGR